MAFPDIQTDKPVGTQMVSTIDDFERETRSWLKNCMQELSGYPDVATISVLGWTNETRPSTNPNGKYLLGYNEDTQSLELIGQTGNIVNISKAFSLAAHPVGEYYWTSDADFNPNTEWGGTWERIRDGRTLISDTDSFPLGSTGGAEQVAISVGQMPPHDHPHSHPHKHDRGTMNIAGHTYVVQDQIPVGDGAFQFISHGRGYAVGGERLVHGGDLYLNAALNWSGYTSQDTTGASYHVSGSGQPHNNMQPYRSAICWHRTA